jgi:hypothetical protein
MVLPATMQDRLSRAPLVKRAALQAASLVRIRGRIFLFVKSRRRQLGAQQRRRRGDLRTTIGYRLNAITERPGQRPAMHVGSHTVTPPSPFTSSLPCIASRLSEFTPA